MKCCKNQRSEIKVRSTSPCKSATNPILSRHVDLIPDNGRVRPASSRRYGKTGSIGFCKLPLDVELENGGGQVPFGS